MNFSPQDLVLKGAKTVKKEKRKIKKSYKVLEVHGVAESDMIEVT